MRKQAFFLVLILLLAVLAGVFAYPRGFGEKYLPWRLGLDLVGGAHLIYEIDLSEIQSDDKESLLGGLRDVIERRVNLFGVGEPRVFIAESERGAELVVELAGVEDVGSAVAEIGATPFLQFYEISGEGESVEPVPTELTGRHVLGATIIQNQTTGVPEVSITFNDEGADLFEEITGRNIGRRVAIVLDGEIISSPVVQGRISGGEAQITGDFTFEEARILVERFNAGALPVPISLVSQRKVSPTLGANSLNSAILAGAIGTALVSLFMLIFYRKLGIFAVLALVLYIVFTLGFFKLTPGFTLSLAGLAGFVLTIGMAVDANILIFERIKEELKRGVSYAVASRDGFRHAWPSIRDANTSTIITAIILYYFTSSFVRGFALTLLVGVLISMLSAVTTTRLLLQMFMKDRKQMTND